jgi:hypothetical protein
MVKQLPAAAPLREYNVIWVLISTGDTVDRYWVFSIDRTLSCQISKHTQHGKARGAPACRLLALAPTSPILLYTHQSENAKSEAQRTTSRAALQQFRTTFEIKFQLQPRKRALLFYFSHRRVEHNIYFTNIS